MHETMRILGNRVLRETEYWQYEAQTQHRLQHCGKRAATFPCRSNPTKLAGKVCLQEIAHMSVL